MVLVGGIMYSTGTESLGPMGLFGAFFGFFLMFLIKGINSCAIINTSKDYVRRFFFDFERKLIQRMGKRIYLLR